MKELSIEQKAQRYDEALERARKELQICGSSDCDAARQIFRFFPELKESEDEGIRKALVELVHDTTGDSLWVDYNVHKEECLAWLEKQGERKKSTKEKLMALSDGKQHLGWLDDADKVIESEQKPADKVESKFKVGDIIRLKDGDGLEWTVEEVLNNGYYTIACADRDDFILLDDNWELVEQKPAEEYNITGIGSKHAEGKLAEMIKELKPLDAILEKQDEQKPVDKVEPKFRVKYAGSEYNVLEVKDIAGVTYYGIEDEPNHIDYVLPDNCEIVSEQKPTWSEEEIEKAAQEWDSKANFNPFYMTMDGDKPTGVKQDVTTHAESFKAGVNWTLKSLRPQSHWKPSDKQIEAVRIAAEIGTANDSWAMHVLEELYTELKKLKG